MTIFQLTLAVEIENTGSVTAAAKVLDVTQPNASTSLKRLEEELGCELFERTSNGWIPTEHGALFFEHAKRVIREEKAMRSVCKMEAISRLRLGVMNYTPAGDAFVRLCEEKKNVPLADFSCVFVSFDEALSLLKERAIDMAICCSVKMSVERDIMTCDENNMDISIIREIPISLRLGKNHPLADILKESPTIENFSLLKDYPYIDYSNLSNLLQVYNDTSSHTFGYSYKIPVSSGDMRLKLVGRTNGYNLGADLPKKRCEPYNIINIPIGIEKFCIVAITRKNSIVTADMKRYLELLAEELDNQFD